MIHDNAARREETRTDKRKNYLKYLAEDAQNTVNSFYLRCAVNTESNADSNLSLFIPYISSAGGIHPQRVQYLPQLSTVKEVSGFYFLPAPAHPDFITSKYCGL